LEFIKKTDTPYAASSGARSPHSGGLPPGTGSRSRRRHIMTLPGSGIALVHERLALVRADQTTLQLLEPPMPPRPIHLLMLWTSSAETGPGKHAARAKWSDDGRKGDQITSATQPPDVRCCRLTVVGVVGWDGEG
jgi:hypothetical protein